MGANYYLWVLETAADADRMQCNENLKHIQWTSYATATISFRIAALMVRRYCRINSFSNAVIECHSSAINHKSQLIRLITENERSAKRTIFSETIHSI